MEEGEYKFFRAKALVRFSFFSLQTPERKERKTEPKRKKLRLCCFVGF